MSASSSHISAMDLEPVSAPAAQESFVFPASFAQQRLWFLDRLAPGNPLYNVCVAVRLRGNLNVPALQQTLCEMVRRHEVLRTTFRMLDGQLAQVVAERPALHIAMGDLRVLPGAQPETAAQRLAAAEMRRPFDLAQGPLLRATLLRLGEADQVVLLTMHHIISDGWSVDLFFREVAALYAAFSLGEPSPLPDLSIQYADFAHWQRQWLQGDVLQTQLAYWQQQLADAPTMLTFPADHSRPAVHTAHGAYLACDLPDDLWAPLRALSRRLGVTLFMVLLAAFKVILRYATRQDDLVVGTDVANRNRAETEGLMGFFVNQLVLRTDLSGNPTFRELLGRVRTVTLGAYDHQDLPFEMLVAALKPGRSLQYAPLFQVKLVLQNPPTRGLQLPGVQASILGIERETAGFDVLLYLWETPTGLRGWFEYSTDLFATTTIARLATQLITVLRQVVAQPETRLHVIDGILAEGDRQQRARQHSEHQALNLHALQNIKRRAMRLSHPEMRQDDAQHR
jgi:hypothetical protein